MKKKKNLIYFSLSINRPCPHVYRLKIKNKKIKRAHGKRHFTNKHTLYTARSPPSTTIDKNILIDICMHVSIYAVHLSDTNTFIYITCYCSLLMLQIYCNILSSILFDSYSCLHIRCIYILSIKFRKIILTYCHFFVGIKIV